MNSFLRHRERDSGKLQDRRDGTSIDSVSLLGAIVRILLLMPRSAAHFFVVGPVSSSSADLRSRTPYIMRKDGKGGADGGKDRFPRVPCLLQRNSSAARFLRKSRAREDGASRIELLYEIPRASRALC